MGRNVGGKESLTPFGRHIRDLRIARDWTQREMMEKSGISICVLSTLERGKRIPTEQMLLKLSKAFGKEHETFRTDSDAPEPYKRRKTNTVKIKNHKDIMTKHPRDRNIKDIQDLQPEKLFRELDDILTGKLKLKLRLSE